MAFSGFGAKPAGSGLFGSFGQQQSTQPTGGLFGQPQQQQQQPQQSTGLFGQQQNTTSGGGLFGQQQQQPQQQQSGGLFGQSTTQQNQPSTGLFGQTQQQQPSTTGGGLFGNTGTQQTGGGLFGNTGTSGQQQQSGGLFGNTSTTSGQTGGGLFGNTSNTTTGQTGGGLFGNTSNTTTGQTGGGLFGNTSNTTTGGGLFGNTGTTTGQTGGGLFGNTSNTTGQTGGLFGNTSTTGQTGGGLFGNTNTQQQQSGGGLFGSTAPLQGQATQPAGGFGGFGLSKLPSQTQQFGASTAAQQGNAPLMTKSTKFNDLPENVRQTLEALDNHIQGRVQISKDLHQRKLGEEPTKGQASIKQLHKELIDIATTIRNDSHTTQDLKGKVDQTIQDARVMASIIDAFRNPQSGNTALKDHANFPLEYFTRIADQMRERLVWYKTTIEQIERKLLSSSGQSQTPQGIVATLQAQHATFLALASKTAALDAEVQKIKVLYTQLWRAKTGSVRDPFNDTPKTSEKADFGMSTLSVR